MIPQNNLGHMGTQLAFKGGESRGKDLEKSFF